MQKIHENEEIFKDTLEELNKATLHPCPYPYNGDFKNIPPSHIGYIFQDAAKENYNGKNFSEIFEDVFSKSKDANLCTFVTGMCFLKIRMKEPGIFKEESNQLMKTISNFSDDIRKPCEKLRELIREFGEYFSDNTSYDDLKKLYNKVSCGFDKISLNESDLGYEYLNPHKMTEKEIQYYNGAINHIKKWYKLYTDYKLEIAAYYLRWFYEWSDIWVLAVFGEEGQADEKEVIKRISKINKSLSPEFLVQNGWFEETPISTSLKIENYKYIAESSDFKEGEGDLIGLLPYKKNISVSVNEIITFQAAKYQDFIAELKAELAKTEDEHEKLKRANEILREKAEELTRYKKENTPEVQKVLDKFTDLIKKLIKYKMDTQDLEQAKRLYNSYGIGLDIILFPICRSVEHEMNVKFFDVVKDWLNVSDVKGGNYVKMLYSKDKPITLGYKFSDIENPQNAKELSNIQKKYYDFYYTQIIKRINAETEFQSLYKISEEVLIKKDDLELKFADIRNTICHRGDKIEIIRKAERLISDILKFLSDTPAIFENIHKLNEKLSKFKKENPHDAEQIKQSLKKLK